ncbi:MAG: hypothetical protein NNA18_06120 [Nitrospira sp.]|nr:hypothetical protein [Nitrospira sp.]
MVLTCLILFYASGEFPPVKKGGVSKVLRGNLVTDYFASTVRMTEEIIKQYITPQE